MPLKTRRRLKMMMVRVKRADAHASASRSSRVGRQAPGKAYLFSESFKNLCTSRRFADIDCKQHLSSTSSPIPELQGLPEFRKHDPRMCSVSDYLFESPPDIRKSTRIPCAAGDRVSCAIMCTHASVMLTEPSGNTIRVPYKKIVRR